MARPATLSHRIDRILLHQVPTSPAARSQQALLAVGVASLSLAVASTMPHPVPQLTIDSFAGRWNTSDGSSRPRADAAGIAGQGPVAWQAQEAETPPPVPQVGSGPMTEARSSPGPVVLPPGAPTTGTLQPAGRTPQQASRRALHTVPRNTPSAPRLVARAAETVSDRDRQDNEVRPTEPVMEEKAPQPTHGTDVPVTSSSPAIDLVQFLPTRLVQLQFPVPALPLGFRRIMGSTCEGTVAIGPNAASSPDKQPFVVPGQRVAARAHFHLRTDGTAWVRFDAFGQRPLELPLRFTGNGVTWTGGYGVAYTVQASGDRSLTGLAGFFHNDSAKLDFTCAKPVADTL